MVFKKIKKVNEIYTLCVLIEMTASSLSPNPSLSPHFGYKYGPLTTLRRGEALKRRKEVLVNKEYRNAYVKFPAVLMARKDGQETYRKIADFSDTCVFKRPVMAGD